MLRGMCIIMIYVVLGGGGGVAGRFPVIGGDIDVLLFKKRMDNFSFFVTKFFLDWPRYMYTLYFVIYDTIRLGELKGVPSSFPQLLTVLKKRKVYPIYFFFDAVFL